MFGFKLIKCLFHPLEVCLLYVFIRLYIMDKYVRSDTKKFQYHISLSVCHLNIYTYNRARRECTFYGKEHFGIYEDAL